MKQDLLYLSLLGFLFTACHPHKTSESKINASPVEPQPAPALAETVKAANLELPGTWTQCTEREMPETRVLSSLAPLVVTAETMTTTFGFYTDSACQKPYTQADMDLDIAEFDKKNGVATPAELKDMFKALVAHDLVKVGYKAEKIAPSSIGQLDLFSAGGNEFLSYKIVDKELYISDSCLPKDIEVGSETNCTLEGESATNRSVDFGVLRPYVRKE